jgi:hypothetical protein
MNKVVVASGPAVPMITKRWTEADYDDLSWHDNHVYGLEIHEGEHGAGELVLHLDYILEWLPPVDGRFSFVVAPAILTFRDVFGLRLELDYQSVTAAMTPFSIGRIDREEVRYSTGHISYRWTVTINWPQGILTFEAPGFTQELIGNPLVTQEPCLSISQRARSECQQRGNRLRTGHAFALPCSSSWQRCNRNVPTLGRRGCGPGASSC